MDDASIFARALAIQSDSERKAFLDEACGQNAELRAEVEALLSANDAAGSFLNHPPVNFEGQLDATIDGELGEISLAFLEPCEKPDRIGRLGVYEIIEVVGQGGMGIVLRAYDTKLNRTVAVKVLTPELAAKPMAVRRFLSEAQKAAAVVHEHVVTIHAVDDSHQPPFLVMEFIDGQTLQQKIDSEGALQLAPILRIGTQIAEGLSAAHERGLIHRDVKPANILLENGVERVKIADFGLARAADDARVTISGQVTGTPLYMSPEQAQGEKVDHRSDLFSLGAVLYAMCTGRPAFRAESHLAVMRRVCDDTPRAIRDVNPEIPEWLAAIVDRLLEKNPEHRIQSASEVAKLLGRGLAHEQSSAQHAEPNAPSGLEPVKKAKSDSDKRRSHRAVTMLILLIAVLGGVAWQFWPRGPHPEAIQWKEADGGNGHWYAVFVAAPPMTWEEAVSRAEEMGGHLVTITSHEEEAFVLQLANDEKYWEISPSAVRNGPWLGAIQLDGSREPDGGWRWVTGEPFCYSNWQGSQPNDVRTSLETQPYIRLIARWGDLLGAQWGDASLRKKTSFVVEWDDMPALSVEKLQKEDPYSILHVERYPEDAEQRSIILRQGTEFRQRREFGGSSKLFVAPGEYSWHVLIPGEEKELGHGTFQIGPGEIIAFTPEGPTSAHDRATER